MSSVPMPGTEGLAHHQLDQDQDRPSIPFTGQLTNIAPYIAAAARHVCPDDVDAEEVARLAVERFSSIGALEHGDAMFHLSPEQLLDEEVAEYADAIIYRARRMAIASPPRLILTPRRLTDEEAERLREQWRAVHAGGASPMVLPTLEQQPAAVRHYGPGSPHSYFADAIASFAGSSTARQRLHEHQRWDQQHAVATTGYSEDNRAEALHPPQGDA